MLKKQTGLVQDKYQKNKTAVQGIYKNSWSFLNYSDPQEIAEHKMQNFFCYISDVG